MDQDDGDARCRGCLKEVSAADRYSFVWPEIKSLFVECTAIKVDDNEDPIMPQGLCKDCYSKCEDWHAFKTMCEEVNEHLQGKASDTINNNRAVVKVESVVADEDMDIHEDLGSHTFGTLIEDDEPMQELKFEADSSDEWENVEDDKTARKECPICKEHFPIVWKHIIDEHVKGLSCPLCNDFRAQRHKMEYHIKNHTGETGDMGVDLKDYNILDEFTAIRKDSIFNSREPWVKLGYPSPKQHKGAQWHCPVCTKGYDNRKVVIAHLVNHTDESPYICIFCKTSFTHKNSVRKHLTFCDTNAARQYLEANPRATRRRASKSLDESPKAKRRSTRNSAEHNKSQELPPKDDPPKVESPGRKRTQPPSPKEDIKVEPESTPLNFARKKPPPTCLICKKKFETSKAVRKHIKKTHPRRDTHPFECEECGNAFPVQARLQQHVLVHSTDRPFQCKLCDARFVGESRLATHIRYVHESEPTAKDTSQCKVCLKWFAGAGILATHVTRYHSASEKQLYPCTKCKKTFDAPHKRNFHMTKCQG